MRVIITIPAYNEEKTLGSVLKSIASVMEHSGHQHKVLVVDDGSTDSTVHIAQSYNAIVVSHPRNLGLAEAFRTEMRECLKMNVDAIVHTDADGQYRANEIPLLLNELEKGYDLVLGSRFDGTIEKMPLVKRLGNRAFSRVISHVTGAEISDAQTGFRAFTKVVAEIPITSTYTYTQEQIIRSARAKLKITEIPIHFDKRGGNTKSRLLSNPFEYAFKAGINLLRIYRDYEPLKFFGGIGLFFFSIGMGVGLWLVYLFITTGAIRRVPTAILSVMLVMVGIQILLFGFLADMNRK
ncbi:glycosyltransferase family 2 protein [Candidatus Woesearchaeota archaeon]|nr:glycosyltransferase family 2 protein [Candidatus Woesearchaeota archaeon]